MGLLQRRLKTAMLSESLSNGEKRLDGNPSRRHCAQRGLFVEMERLRIEFRSESLNLHFGDPQSTGAERLPHRKVFEISPANLQ
jgi:hypothetical protein